jgi:hypothetical protein
MAERSKELIMVGYFLSRFGKSSPPESLNISKWKNAYKVFYNKLSEGRSVSQFEHSLKNSRDAFDSYFSETEREGWKADDGSPSKLTGYSLDIYNYYENLNEEEVFLKIESFISQYEAKKGSQFGIEHIKEDFANWLLNQGKYKRVYKGDKSVLIDKLSEFEIAYKNDFGIAIFDFPKLSINTIIGALESNIIDESGQIGALNKRIVGNGSVKAILGPNNYIKFLTEKFNYRAPNYWIFQGNPNIYDSSAALKAGHLKSWKVAAHKDKIKIGDQVILWQTGNQSGCYALAEVTSDVKAFEEETNEQQYYTEASNTNVTERVKIKIIKNLVEDPILWQDIKENPTFLNFKAGNQGTNFSATEAEFNELLHLHTRRDIKYWLYSPGGNADHWDEFYDVNIMAIGWDKLGDLKQYKSKDEIRDALHRTNGDNKRKPNKVAANYEFVNTMQIGDIIIVKQGRGKLLGYGVVTSDYFYDEKRGSYKSCRNVDWKLKGIWDSGHSLALKTLTDITKNDSEHEGHDKYSDYLLGIMNRDNKLNLNSTIKEIMKPTNQILYGPPGTGKTFHLKEHLFEKYTSRETSISLEQHFENVVSGCSWWQVIAIALLDLEKAKVSEIHAHRWVQKKASLSNSTTIRPTLWGQLQSHTIDTCAFVNVSSRQQPLIFNKTEDSYWEILEEEVKELVPELFDLKDSIENYNPDPDNSIKHYDFVTFHQSFAYEDFIEGIKPVLPENDEQATDLGYTIEDGVFKKLCVSAKNDPDNCYAIFIDEINRGNVSAIFGELITLIEVDKRQGAKNELSIKLPYSKTAFSVPSNLDIYGTMNTADRSVEALDTALRRRFEFKEMMPDYTVIESEEVNGLQLSKLLKTINDRIELLIDRDHTVGHSYFVNINSEQELANAFNNKIVPLLQEYFYGDFGKIGLVLGKGFVQKQKNDKVNFADFTYENANDFKTATFVIKQVDSASVVEAVRLLLGQEKEIE